MFVVCADCRRHIRKSEAACPFCGGGRYVHREAPDLSGRRLDRLALLTFATSVVACGGGQPPPPASVAPAPTTSAPEATPAPSSAPSTQASAPDPGPAPAPSPTPAPAPTSSDVAVGPNPPKNPPGPGVSAYGAPFPGLNPGAPGIGAYGAPSKPGLGGGVTMTWKSPTGTIEDTRVLRSRAAPLRACYQAELAKDPTLVTTCKLEATISTGGKPTKVDATCTAAPPSLAACLKSRVLQATFVEGEARKAGTVIDFKPN